VTLVTISRARTLGRSNRQGAYTHNASRSVSSRTMHTNPVAIVAQRQDSLALTFGGGNAWRRIGGNWTLILP
jgi:hypothetical protein